MFAHRHAARGIQLCTLADVHDHRSDFGSALHCGKAVESLKDTVLASPEQDDSSRVKSQGLTSEFPANGTARTGDEDAKRGSGVDAIGKRCRAAARCADVVTLY